MPRAVNASVLPGVRFPYVYFLDRGGRGQTLPRCPSGSPRPVKRKAPCRYQLPRAGFPVCCSCAGYFLFFKSIRCPAAGSIISKRPARIKRGRSRHKDSLRVFNTLGFFDSPQTLYFQCLQQSALDKKSLRLDKKSLRLDKKSLRNGQKVAAEILKQE